MTRPTLTLADEPTGSLDPEIVRDIFAQHSEDMGKTVIAVTHEQDFSAAAHRNIHLVDGRIVKDKPQKR